MDEAVDTISEDGIFFFFEDFKITKVKLKEMTRTPRLNKNKQK